MDSVLFVDDDLNVLKSYKRTMSSSFKVTIASEPEEGLRLLAEKGPFAVIVSDMKMPGMNGIEVLTRAQQISPDTSRILLTGYADQQTAIDAVNKGEVFRFLTKPCEVETLASMLKAAARQHQLLVSERELLEQTLFGTVTVLSQILTLINPVAQGKANRLKKYCRFLATKTRFKDQWMVEMAALLSQLGCLTIPQEVVAKYVGGGKMKAEELQMVKDHPGLAVKLLSKIPRLEKIVEIIALQEKPLKDFPRYADQQDGVPLAAKILQTALGLDKLIMSGMPPHEALDQMDQDERSYDRKLVQLLMEYDFGLQNMVQLRVECKDLNRQMILDEDVRTIQGVLLASKGQRVTEPVLRGILNYSMTVGVHEPFLVLVPLAEFANAP